MGLAVLTLAPPAAAQPPGFSDEATFRRFLEYRNTPNYMRMLLNTALKDEQTILPRCEDLENRGRRLVAVIEPVIFAEGAGQPSSGLWLERVILGRCGAEAYRNIIFYVSPGDPVKTSTALPGLTLADLDLQYDTGVAIMAVYRHAYPKCRDLTIVDTRVVTKPPATGGTWVESWSFYVCDDVVQHEIRFIPNAQGRVTYSFKPPSK